MSNSRQFLDSLDQLAMAVKEMSQRMSPEMLGWVSANRDFGEDERYREKTSVDDVLRSNKTTISERERIEAIFDSCDEISKQVENYLLLLDRRLVEVHSELSHAAEYGSQWTVENHVDFWSRFARIADIDNAHAMYFSSGNWNFSVFNALISALESLAGGNDELLYALLTGGICDVRTSVYDVFSGQYEGLTRSRFVEAVKADGDWTREGGYVTIMCFNAATGERGRLSARDLEVKSEFARAVDWLERQNPGVNSKEIIELYVHLYESRRRYDVYEYFGAYAFLRNVVIYRLGEVVSLVDKDIACQAQYLATTYQFERAAELLRRV